MHSPNARSDSGRSREFLCNQREKRVRDGWRDEHESRKEKGDKGNKVDNGQLIHVRLVFDTAPLPSLCVRLLSERRLERVGFSLPQPFVSRLTHPLQVSATYNR